jgi:thymidylate kinase
LGEEWPVLVALEGIDGVGKSTIAPDLCERLRQTVTVDVELWRKSDPVAAPGPAAVKARELHDLIWRHPEGEPEADVLGTRYHLFLHAAWFALVQRYRVRPLRARPGAVAIADGWYYRSVAKAVARDGLSEQWCLSLFESAGAPDLVVLVDVDPRVAWHRREGRFSPWELGRWDGGVDDPYTSFCAYQTRLRLLLHAFAVRYGWAVVAPDESWSRQRVLHAVHERIIDEIGGSDERVRRHPRPGAGRTP